MIKDVYKRQILISHVLPHEINKGYDKPVSYTHLRPKGLPELFAGQFRVLIRATRCGKRVEGFVLLNKKPIVEKDYYRREKMERLERSQTCRILT